jgi:hypothetical protein
MSNQIIVATTLNDIKGTPMKVMDRTDKRAMKEYLTRPINETHTQEEQAALHRAIAFTKMYYQNESNEIAGDAQLNNLLKDL